LAPISGHHQQLGRVVRAAGDDHLALGAHLERLAAAVDAGRADRARALEQQLQYVAAGTHLKVRPLHHGVQVADRGAGARAVAVGHLVPTHAIL
jgi:hypothetical protein